MRADAMPSSVKWLRNEQPTGLCIYRRINASGDDDLAFWDEVERRLADQKDRRSSI
jgi:hypothetical protein